MFAYSLIDLLRGTYVVKEYNNIKKEVSQGYDFLENLRREKLINLYKKLMHHPFYRELILGFDESTIQKDPIKVLKSLPLTSKKQISSYNTWFRDIDSTQSYEKRFTGGSTGTPFNYFLSKYSISRITAFNYFLWNHFIGYNIGDRILSLGGDSLGKEPSWKIKLYNRLQQKFFIPGDIISNHVLEAGLKLIFNTRYDVIYAYTSSLGYFVDEAIKRNMVFKHKIKGVVTVSEMLPETTLKKFQGFFNCDVLNCYGARDGGVMGGELNSIDTGFYTNFYDCIVESMVVDEKLGKSELILTNLGNYSFPFVRYRVGDIGVLENYNSAFHLPLHKITHFEGRTRDMVYTRSGGVVHGSAFNAILKSAPGINNYQIVQNADFNIEIRIKSTEPNLPEELIINLIRSLINDPGISITISLTNEFVHSNNQKHKIIVSYVDQASALNGLKQDDKLVGIQNSAVIRSQN